MSNLDLDKPDTECEDCAKPLYSITHDQHERVLCGPCRLAWKRRISLINLTYSRPWEVVDELLAFERENVLLKEKLAQHEHELEMRENR